MQREGGKEGEGGGHRQSEREHGEREGLRFRERTGREGEVYASGWLTELVEPSGTFALRVTVVVFALQLGYVEACFRIEVLGFGVWRLALKSRVQGSGFRN